ncbi:MAG: biotin/lipoyl-containing protein [Desulfomonilaceae bacterium]|nr:biotin/lipoyl-containing protein [Desulfomonilaceae bacterium]
MEYRVRIDEQVYPLVATSMDDKGRCTMGPAGEPEPVVIKVVSSNHVRLEIQGRARSIFAARSDDGTWIWCDGRARVVKDADLEERRKSRAPGATAREITPPTPASVVRILVETGDRVAKGQGIVTVSAMKMEMTLTAPYSGTVTAINTSIGAQVSPGEILAEIAPDDEGDGNE